MREKNLLQMFLVLNVALAGAFVIYLFLSSSRQPKVETASFPAAATNKAISPILAAATRTNATNSARSSITPTNALSAVTNADVASAATNAAPAQPVFTQKKFDWRQVETDEYRVYLQSLRAVGCPEERLRYIVLADINELFDKKRVQEAVTRDIQWWRAEPELMLVNTLQEKGRQLEEERRTLIERLLGGDTVETEKSEAMLWNSVQLTGPVLGALPVKLHNEVQEICARSMERHQAAFWARANEGQPINNVEMAKLRDQTRTDLRKLLNDDAIEEFLLRYSHNANRLRQELRGFDPTPEEFRKVFRLTDQLDHQLQLESGGPETLSVQQRERYERQRDAAIKEAIAPARYEAYLLTKDPLYRQAQMTAMQYGAPTRAIMPIYQMVKAHEARRREILNDASLTPEQKSQKLQAVNTEQMQSVQKIVSDAAQLR